MKYKKAKITISCGDKSMSYCVSMDELREYFNESEGPQKSFKEWTKDITLDQNKLQECNGSHCLYGEIEAFMQSDGYSPLFFEDETDFIFSFEKV